MNLSEGDSRWAKSVSPNVQQELVLFFLRRVLAKRDARHIMRTCTFFFHLSPPPQLPHPNRCHRDRGPPNALARAKNTSILPRHQSPVSR